MWCFSVNWGSCFWHRPRSVLWPLLVGNSMPLPTHSPGPSLLVISMWKLQPRLKATLLAGSVGHEKAQNRGSPALFLQAKSALRDGDAIVWWRRHLFRSKIILGHKIDDSVYTGFSGVTLKNPGLDQLLLRVHGCKDPETYSLSSPLKLIS